MDSDRYAVSRFPKSSHRMPRVRTASSQDQIIRLQRRANTTSRTAWLAGWTLASRSRIPSPAVLITPTASSSRMPPRIAASNLRSEASRKPARNTSV